MMIERVKGVLKHTLDDWKDQQLVEEIRGFCKLMEHGGMLGLQQVLEELQQLKDWIGLRRFKNFLELGSDDGGTLFLYSHMFCLKGASVTSVDFQGKPNLARTIKTLNDEGYHSEMIVKHSHDVSINIPNIDLLHIDAMHSIDAVVGDWNKYYPHIDNDGIIIMHDTLLHEGPVETVKWLVKNGLKCKTFGGTMTISNDTNIAAGITVVRKCDNLNRDWNIPVAEVWAHTEGGTS